MLIDHRHEAVSCFLSLRGRLLLKLTPAAIAERLSKPDSETDVIIATAKTECLLLLLLRRAGIT